MVPVSALFAAATAPLAKLGVADLDSNLATVIRTNVVVIFAWALRFRWHRTPGWAQASV